MELTIDGVINEIKDIEYCIDNIGSSFNAEHSDFEGFRFTLFSGEQLTVQSGGCNTWLMQELGGKRLIGFRVVETDYPQNTGVGLVTERNIRQIQAIVDCVACDTSLIQLNDIDNKELVIGSGSSAPIVIIDDPVSRNYL